ncbi:hypothetical protein FACS1894190_01820 [Spirochaetia bacterium]|nr:hypothetical protein FACS1894190_01820 [Spirochaetia bacterium]
MKLYVIDACSFIASLSGEPGGDDFVKIILEALDGSVSVRMNQINFLEVYYKMNYRAADQRGISFAFVPIL